MSFKSHYFENQNKYENLIVVFFDCLDFFYMLLLVLSKAQCASFSSQKKFPFICRAFQSLRHFSSNVKGRHVQRAISFEGNNIPKIGFIILLVLYYMLQKILFFSWGFIAFKFYDASKLPKISILCHLFCLYNLNKQQYPQNLITDYESSL